MLANPSDILIVEDTTSLAYLYKSFLEKDAHTVSIVETGADALLALKRRDFDLIILDLLLPDMDGFDILRTMAKDGISTPVIVSTSDGSVERATEAMRIGAVDFLVKPFNEQRLVVTVRNVLDQIRLKTDVCRLQEAAPKADFGGFVGASAAMRAVFSTITNVASSKATIFITGESGTGKEVAAEAIHNTGRGSKAPFVAVNCGAIPHSLFESEVFGHKKGSFTGAIADYDGAAVRANGGTLFLDEICEMDLDLQTKLLRFLQTSMVQPVGGRTPVKVDVRIICATNRDPVSEVQQGRFREDLYYRLNVIPLEMPPLRERGDDVVRLAEHFLSRYGADEGKTFDGFDAGAKAALLTRPWVGNVRELENLIRQVAVLAPAGTVDAANLPAVQTSPVQPPIPDTAAMAGTVSNAYSAAAGHNVQSYGQAQLHSSMTAMPQGSAGAGAIPDIASASLSGTLTEIEHKIVEARIAHMDGNITQAAQSLGISPSTIYRKRENWAALGLVYTPPQRVAT